MVRAKAAPQLDHAHTHTHICFHSGPNAAPLTEGHVSMTTDRKKMRGTSCFQAVGDVALPDSSCVHTTNSPCQSSAVATPDFLCSSISPEMRMWLPTAQTSKSETEVMTAWWPLWCVCLQTAALSGVIETVNLCVSADLSNLYNFTFGKDWISINEHLALTISYSTNGIN